tara:strand:+ start:480 stop:728 length:249 start_codon:yes stop_codon:yes gene_type:complete
MISKLKTQAMALKTKYVTEDNIAKAKELSTKAVQYAKDNPSDIMVGIITLMVMDMDDSIDAIEESTGVSAFVDADEYINYRA